MNMEKARIILGLMRIENLTTKELSMLIHDCLSLGINHFDISDIYLNHKAEEKLGQVLKEEPQLRKEMFIQTKCGIVRDVPKKTWMDLSYSHIKEACYASLKRMNLSYLDCLLLHRVDIFMDAKEISRALSELHEEGKVMHFGVSNMDRDMIEYLSEEVTLPLELNQLQVSLGQLALVSETFNVNFPQQNPNLSNGLFFYMKRKHMKLQCWSPYQYGFFSGSIFDSEKFPELNMKLDELAKKYDSTKCGIATAFLCMLTDECEVITGSTNIEHIKESLDGSRIRLSRQDWYDLYCSTGNLLP